MKISLKIFLLLALTTPLYGNVHTEDGVCTTQDCAPNDITHQVQDNDSNEGENTPSIDINVVKGKESPLPEQKPTEKTANRKLPIDKHKKCELWASLGECKANPDYMLENCGKSCHPYESEDGILFGVKQFWREIRDHVLAVKIYIDEEISEDDKTKGTCRNYHELCSYWAVLGGCEGHEQQHMIEECAPACFACHLVDPKDAVDVHFNTEDAGHNYNYKQDEDGITFGVRQVWRDLRDHIRDVKHYMQEEIMNHEDDKMEDKCRNKHEFCTEWAVMNNWCETDFSFMLENCAPACMACGERYDEEGVWKGNGCPIDPDATPALRPGDLNTMFERIAGMSPTSELAQYKPTVHSRPTLDEDEEQAFYDEPWLIAFDSFLTEEECDRFISIKSGDEFEASSTYDYNDDGTSEHVLVEERTSETKWCFDCENDPILAPVYERIINVTNGIPFQNHEDIQLLKYEEGQFYRNHHDYADLHVSKPCGPRILTMYFYLNDVEAGGGTHFPYLNEDGFTISPKKGRAVLWPSVLDKYPSRMDPRTFHEALEVEKGKKFGANVWIHLYNFEAAYDDGCTD